MDRDDSQHSAARLLLTLGDAAGIGPEVICRARCNADAAGPRCIVVGSPAVLHRAAKLLDQPMVVRELESLPADEWPAARPDELWCWNPIAGTLADAAVAAVTPGHDQPAAGRAAYEYLLAAGRACLQSSADGVVTAPLSKAALHLAGLEYPGHTEILGELCGVRDFGMMLYLPKESLPASHAGLGVAHVTLHTSVRSVPELITAAGVTEKIVLLDRFLKTLGVESPRIGVCALNPHAGESGLFGDEESRLISPGIESARGQAGVAAAGPLPADTLIQRAIGGAFDGVVAMYHDQGHIPLKLVGLGAAVNVTLGLPIVRTSPSHGTAFDIAWTGRADPRGMRTAIDVAAKLVAARLQGR
jgi:4-hydroxythreonine-4-phosphate dehydrogenase